MGGDRNDKRSRGHGGSKRKFVQACSLASPSPRPETYGEHSNRSKLCRHLGETSQLQSRMAWEELIAQGVKQGPIISPALPKAELATDAQPDSEASERQAAGEGPAEQPAAKAQRSHSDPAVKDTQAGPAATTPGAEDGNGDDEDGDDGAGDALDFSKMISSEVKDLKDVKKQAFVVHDTGIKTCMFIGMPLAAEDKPGPCEVVKHVLRKAKETRVLRLRHCLRLLPCTHVVRSQAVEIDAAVKAAVSMAIDCSEAAEPLTTAVLYEHRAAPSELNRMKLIDSSIAHVPRPPHSVKLKGAAKTISLQVMRNSCGVAVLDNYEEFKKYNIKTLCQDPEEEEKKAKEKAKASGEDKAAEDKADA